MLHRFTIIAALAACAFVAACDDDDDNALGPEDFASVRVVNAASSAPSIDVFSNNQALASSVDFLHASECFDVEAGIRDFQVRSAGTANTLLGISARLTGNTNYTLVVLGTGFDDAGFDLFTFEARALPPDEALLRLIHNAPTAGAVDVYLGDPNAEPFIEPIQYLPVGVAANILISASHTRFIFTATGSTTPLFEIPTLTFPPSRVATLVLTEDEQGDFQFVSAESCG